MNFADHRILWLVPVLLPALLWFFWRAWRRKQELIRQFVQTRLLDGLLDGVSPSREKGRFVLITVAVLFLMLALARPQWGFVWEEASQRGRDIVVAIDTSRSMLAADMAPNRLTRAKLAALDLLRLAKNDRLGLVAFAGGAFLQSPLTLDDEAFRQNIEVLDTAIIPQGGTAITEAISAALGAFDAEGGDNHKVLVIFTDGEDHEAGVMDAVRKGVEKGLKIFTVGVGTPGGELLRVTGEDGRVSFVKDEQGNVVKSRLDEDLLRKIATEADGFYIPLRDANAMQVLYERGLAPLPTTEISSKIIRRLSERFQWPLAVAILLLLVEVLIPASPAAKKKPAPARPLVRAAIAAALLCLAVSPAQASSSRALKNYQEGKFKDARKEYERLLEKNHADQRLQYNAAAAAFQAGQYDAAVKGFSSAVGAADPALQQMAHYNLANAQYRLGEAESDPSAKIATWEQALENYQQALKLNPKDADAEFNQKLVQQRLEELKKQQPPQKQDSKDKDSKEDNKAEQKKSDEKKEKDSKGKEEKQDNQQKKDASEEEKKEQQQAQQEKEQKDKEQAEKEQQQTGSEKEEKDPKGGKEQAAQKPDPDKKAEAEQEARAAQLGQMTPRQAEKMLDAQKSDEKALIFLQPKDKQKARPRVFKDW